MISQRWLVDAGSEDVWQLTVNTQATTSGEKTTGIPINLVEQPNVVLMVDWGDGSKTKLDSSMYTTTNSTASVHTYASPGIYTISISSRYWRSCNLLTIEGSKGSFGSESISTPTIDNMIAPLYWMQRTLTGVGVLPRIRGSYYCSRYNTPEIVTDLYSSINSVGDLFAACTKLTTIASGLFSKNPQLTNFRKCFAGCTSLTSIPQDIFWGCSAASDMDRCFHGCFSLASIPQKLFRDCPYISDFTGTFEYMPIRTVPSDLFSYGSNGRNFSSTFMYCTELQSIPANLFSTQSSATTFEQCFAGCLKLTAVPSGLFDACVNVTNFRRVFSDCKTLATIPSGLFAYNTKATSFIGSFGAYSNSGSRPSFNEVSGSYWGSNNEALTTIPSDLFANCASATSFGSTFKGCTKLASIPATLFADCPNATSFSECFSYCSTLQSVPANLFASNTNATTFSNCFSYCSSLRTIPAGLFASNNLVTSFYSLFRECSSLQSIPSGLFANNPKVTDFSACFYQCESITAIPNGLFDACTVAFDFSYCFQSTAITAIPTNLFKYTVGMKTAYQCFAVCNSLRNGIVLHIGSSIMTEARGFVRGPNGNASDSVTIYVPANSTTHTTFNNAGLTYVTIIGE